MSTVDQFYITMLYDFYHELLTEKQKEYFEDYYFNNFSLSEIAESYEISRNAVFDQLNKTVKILNEYEEKLKLYQKFLKYEEIIKKIKELVDDEEVKKLLALLEGIE